ncbi:recombinase family protein [Escherichia coli]|nr:recombinase family protein [Escherichia coli]
MRTLLSYVRWSSDEQAKGDSLKRQRDLIETYQQAHPELLVDPEHQYFDRGVSSFKQVVDPNDIDGEIMRSVNRATGDLSRLFANLDAKKIPRDSVLIVEQIDRLGRSKPTQALEDFLRLVNYGIEIVTLGDNMTYNQTSANANMTSIMMYFMKAWVGYEESLKKSLRIQSVNRKRIAAAIASGKPMGAITPGWIVYDKDNDKFTVDDVRANIVRHIYTLRLEGNSFYRIAIMLNDANTMTINSRKIRLDRLKKEAKNRLIAQGNKAPTEKEIESETYAEAKAKLIAEGNENPTEKEIVEEAKRNVGDWSRETVKYLLQTETVLGTLPETKDHPSVPNYYPAIIDFTTFNTVQGMSTFKNCGKRSRTDSPIYVNIFRKMLTCGDCGLTMTPSGMRPPVYFGVYRCNCFVEKRKREPKAEPSTSAISVKRQEVKRMGRKRAEENNNPCRTASVKVFDLALCNNLFANLAQYSTDKVDRLRISDLEQEQVKLRNKIKKARQMIFAEEEAGDIDPDLLDMINKMRKREKEVDAELKKELIRANTNDADTLAGLDLINSSADRTQAQNAIQKLVKEVVVYGSRHTCDVHFYNGSVIREFDYLATDNLTDTLQRATDNDRLRELAEISGVRVGLGEFYGQIKESDAPDYSDWPDAEEPDYPNTNE